MDEKFGKENHAQRNFRGLLWFWREYYCSCGRDSISLEKTSCIPFAEFQSVVAQLCADNVTQPLSLVDAPFANPRDLAPHMASAVEWKWR